MWIFFVCALVVSIKSIWLSRKNSIFVTRIFFCYLIHSNLIYRLTNCLILKYGIPWSDLGVDGALSGIWPWLLSGVEGGGMGEGRGLSTNKRGVCEFSGGSSSDLSNDICDKCGAKWWRHTYKNKIKKYILTNVYADLVLSTGLNFQLHIHI